MVLGTEFPGVKTLFMIPPMAKGTLSMALVAPPTSFNFSSIIPPTTFPIASDVGLWMKKFSCEEQAW